MKRYYFLILTVFVSNFSIAEEENPLVTQLERASEIFKTRGLFNWRSAPYEDHETEHKHVFTPQQEEAFRTHFMRNKSTRADFRFQQTSWKECTDDPSGNYSGIGCASSRQISQILKDFMQDFIYECVDAGLRAQGNSAADDIHVVHDGILGDRNHSPRSLHAEARAIDIRSIDVKLVNGSSRKITYAGTSNRSFYTAFRSCWGNVVKRENGCPLYQGNAGRTGSIGWEDRNHQNHMHTSVPYCVNGRYGSYYFQK